MLKSLHTRKSCGLHVCRFPENVVLSQSMMITWPSFSDGTMVMMHISQAHAIIVRRFVAWCASCSPLGERLRNVETQFCSLVSHGQPVHCSCAIACYQTQSRRLGRRDGNPENIEGKCWAWCRRVAGHALANRIACSGVFHFVRQLSVFPCIAEAPLGMFLKNQKLSAKLIMGTLFASATGGAPYAGIIGVSEWGMDGGERAARVRW